MLAALRHDLARGRDDTALADHVKTLFIAALCDTDGPGRVLITAGLEDQVVVERLQGIEIETVAQSDRRVVAAEHHLHALQAHDPPCFRPSPVVADAHADDAIEGTEHPEAIIADFEVALSRDVGRVGPWLRRVRECGSCGTCRRFRPP